MKESWLNSDNGLWVLGGFISMLIVALLIFLLIPGVWTNSIIHVTAHTLFTILVIFTLFIITKKYYVLFIGIPLIVLFSSLNSYSVYTQSMKWMYILLPVQWHSFGLIQSPEIELILIGFVLINTNPIKIIQSRELSIQSQWVPLNWKEYISFIFYVILLTFAIIVSIWKVLLTKNINTNLICGALTIYLFSGILWGKLYFLINGYIPDSFKGIESIAPSSSDLLRGYATQFNFIYYSFTTLATVGVGDISPLFPLGKTLTMLEAMFGQLYVATVIAKVVSVWHKSSSDSISGDL